MTEPKGRWDREEHCQVTLCRSVVCPVRTFGFVCGYCRGTIGILMYTAPLYMFNSLSNLHHDGVRSKFYICLTGRQVHLVGESYEYIRLSGTRHATAYAHLCETDY